MNYLTTQYNNKFAKSNVTKNQQHVASGVVSKFEIQQAIINNQFWTVLNKNKVLNMAQQYDNKEGNLEEKIKLFKDYLEVNGYNWANTPGMPETRGKNTNADDIYHGHIYNKGTTYILEWAVIDPIRKILALVGFKKHENYSFKKSLSEDQKQNILNDPENVKILKKVSLVKNAITSKLQKNKLQFV